jgi:uncharacterized protein YicC (UPF0701 family)
MLNKQEKEMFLGLSRSTEGEVLKDYIEKLIVRISSVDNMTTDVIKNQQQVASLIKNELLEYLTESKIEQEVPESWE